MCPSNIFRHNQITFQSVCREVISGIRKVRNQYARFLQFINLLLHFRRQLCLFRIHRSRKRYDQHFITDSTRQCHPAIFHFRQPEQCILVETIIGITTKRIHPFLRINHIGRMRNAHRTHTQRLSFIRPTNTLTFHTLRPENTRKRRNQSVRQYCTPWNLFSCENGNIYYRMSIL